MKKVIRVQFERSQTRKDQKTKKKGKDQYRGSEIDGDLVMKRKQTHTKAQDRQQSLTKIQGKKTNAK